MHYHHAAWRNDTVPHDDAIPRGSLFSTVVYYHGATQRCTVEHYRNAHGARRQYSITVNPRCSTVICIKTCAALRCNFTVSHAMDLTRQSRDLTTRQSCDGKTGDRDEIRAMTAIVDRVTWLINLRLPSTNKQTNNINNHINELPWGRHSVHSEVYGCQIARHCNKSNSWPANYVLSMYYHCSVNIENT